MRLKRNAIAVACIAGAALVAISVSVASTTSRTAASDISELRWATTPISGLDQTKKYAYPDLTIQRLGIEHLLQFSTAGKLEPSLATAVKRPSLTTYVYTLRSRVKFWDGQALTANDVAFSLNRNKGPSSTIAVFYRNVQSIAVTGPLEVTVKLKKPDSSWPFATATAAPIVEKDFAEAHPNDIGSPAALNMGTGPFKFTSFALNQNVVLTRNDSWWGGHVAVQKLTISLLPTASAIALALRSGTIDGYLTRGEDLRPFARIPNTKLRVTGGSTPMYISMNTRTGPWADVHVRRAVAHLVDRPAMIKAVEGGYGQPLDTLLPQSLLSFIAAPAQVKTFYNSYRKYPFSLATAKKEMALSKYPSGFSAVWPIYAVTDAVAVAQVMAQNMKKLGITIKIKELPFAQWLAIYYGPKNKYGITNLTFGSATYTSYHFDLMVNSANAKPQGSNSADFHDKQVDKLLRTNAQAQSPKVQLAALTGIAKIVAEKVPYVVLFAQDDGLVLSNKYAMQGFADSWQFRPWGLNIEAA
jgi:peptide/nickel transport system substrate-binding protein